MKNWKAPVWVAAGVCATLVVGGALSTVPAIAAAARAALVRDADNPALQPVRIPVLTSLEPGQFNEITVAYTVPAGKRLVIENVSVWGLTNNPGHFTGIWLNVQGQTAFLLLNPTTSESRPLEGGSEVIAYNRAVKAYYNPGEVLEVYVFVEGVSNTKLLNMYLQGYLVNL